ncbi:hypothetical protein L6164_031118 [Bauhinia variegata]|uniref:Uncharacterized protein n=1 Tax=Bauhinia variegata TaxID=167791 RepID=A0ACB9LEG8_BAUVA|nr:hypothetical protein L6164_031118 [Bauhinia variegata]
MVVGAILHVNGNSTVRFSCRSNLDRSRSQLPAMVKVKAPESYWASLHADVEAHLRQAIPMKEPLVVFEPMHHLVFAAPRTAVPALCVAACEVVGGRRDQAMAAASALMLMQAATHTHENLPLTDRPKPRPMTDQVYDPNIELLTGDGIVPFGFEILAKSGQAGQSNSGAILRVIIEISRAMGSQGVIDGQYCKVLGTQSDGEDSCHEESKKNAIEKNGGRLHACGAACGAMLGGGSEEEIERLRRYGFYVGMIQGMLQLVETKDKGLMEQVEDLRNLALKELQAFDSSKIEPISCFINV